MHSLVKTIQAELSNQLSVPNGAGDRMQPLPPPPPAAANHVEAPEAARTPREGDTRSEGEEKCRQEQNEGGGDTFGPNDSIEPPAPRDTVRTRATTNDRKSAMVTADGRHRSQRETKTILERRLGRRQDLFEEMGPDKSDLSNKEYDVADMYWEDGVCQAIARSGLFANITLTIIGINSIYIGIDADHNDQDNLANADVGFQVCENLFCIFFSFEWLVRFFAFRHKVNCVKDLWFTFDTALVLMMIVETWLVPLTASGGVGIPTGMIKMLRLLRLARCARLIRNFPEVVAMMKGVRKASRAVASALLMLVVLVYVFGVMLFTLLKTEQDQIVSSRFRDLTTTMFTLLIDGTFMDNIGFVSRSLLETKSYIEAILLMWFVLCSALTVMNMLIGVLCEVVSAVAAAEKEDNAIRLVKGNLLTMLRELDEDQSGHISRDEIQRVLDDEASLETLYSLNVEVKYLMEQLDMLYEEEGHDDELSIHQIMNLILMLRGDRPSLMSDLLHFQTFNQWKTAKQLERLEVHIGISQALERGGRDSDEITRAINTAVAKVQNYQQADKEADALYLEYLRHHGTKGFQERKASGQGT
eukprot:gnl/TRDRNA2_/TRDRNA2_94598_c0_seq1.p1 gnl/TRDRNA2_/TRDRNA2_94598_c0~~gnl/TRDRNA2_/TRDRNA2_94598_c0_seq1.p1  ORF type:complete len:586 (+),score=119.53 gnl/TRDRNA2_/TRDRNA2_94598_c0_seq1:62-1819(+)